MDLLPFFTKHSQCPKPKSFSYVGEVFNFLLANLFVQRTKLIKPNLTCPIWIVAVIQSANTIYFISVNFQKRNAQKSLSVWVYLFHSLSFFTPTLPFKMRSRDNFSKSKLSSKGFLDQEGELRGEGGGIPKGGEGGEIPFFKLLNLKCELL